MALQKDAGIKRKRWSSEENEAVKRAFGSKIENKKNLQWLKNGNMGMSWNTIGNGSMLTVKESDYFKKMLIGDEANSSGDGIDFLDDSEEENLHKPYVYTDSESFEPEDEPNLRKELKSGMDYLNLGVKNQLCANLSRYSEATRAGIQELSLSLNIDGLPLFKSTCNRLWPVLCSINIKPVVVFPIVLTFGKSKHRNLDFLTDLFNELTEIPQNGMAFEK
ncbi:hypothetical protein MAR_032461 [Mya arenaria]|uniref:Uncharacterized protein n=1 Tax=Mya arenaria TaxID=6604 RepID=A0ABY7F8B7_MYAAR|nr:hypothetical protein MAR_032461 [Mya arenaria]